MKKSIFTLVVVCFAMSVAAAEMPNQGFGVHMGWAQTVMRLNSPNTDFPKDSLANTIHLHGFKVGVVYDASYIAGFGSTIGINYTFGTSNTKWAKEQTKMGFANYSERYQYLYNEVELFVDWQYKFEVAKETYLILYTGPSLQLGATYTTRYERRNDATDEVTTSVINHYDKHEEIESNIDLNRLNVTWGVGAGFQYRRYFLRGGYDFGLINPHRNKQFVYPDGNTTTRNTRGRIDQWSIKLGIYLWYGN